MKLWHKGLNIDTRIEAFTVGDDYLRDLDLIEFDCEASVAHAEMLGEAGFLSNSEVRKISLELGKIKKEARKGLIRIPVEMEDCHTWIENRLSEKLGDSGKKIHTGRSRNDQVLTALRLYTIDRVKKLDTAMNSLRNSLSKFAAKYPRLKFPGFTHTRKAMPSSIKLWSEAFSDSLTDERQLLRAALKLLNQCPLGTGAGYGIPLPISRIQTAKRLGFRKIQKNPIYAQLSRGKFELFVMNCMSQIMLTLNRLASDIILFSLPDLGYFLLPNTFCTGSSIMPQKQNPDIFELVRAYCHIVAGLETQIRSVCTNLITGYHRDFQLTKAPLMDGFKITLACLDVMTAAVEVLQADKAKCESALTPEIWATHKAYELVKSGVPFRVAYKKIAEEYK